MKTNENAPICSACKSLDTTPGLLALCGCQCHGPERRVELDLRAELRRMESIIRANDHTYCRHDRNQCPVTDSQNRIFEICESLRILISEQLQNGARA